MRKNDVGECCCVCKASEFEAVVSFLSPLPNENTFGFNGSYFRELRKCHNCHSYFNFHNIDLDEIYFGQYRESSYVDSATESSRFHKIISLPESKSDNKKRCRYLIEKALKNLQVPSVQILDIGSGMGVFPYEMALNGYSVDTVDPDQKNCEFIRSLNIPGNVYAGRFEDLIGCFTKKYDVISLNKVLEHVRDFYSVIDAVKKILAVNGVIYIELPDADGAANDSYTRQEFFLEHYFTPSRQGIKYIAENAGLEIIDFESLIEPSGKYTSRFVSKLSPCYA